MNYKFLLVLGIMLLLTRFLGIPGDFKDIIYLLVAIFLMVYSFVIRSRYKKNDSRSDHGSSYVESRFGQEYSSRESSETLRVEDEDKVSEDES